MSGRVWPAEVVKRVEEAIRMSYLGLPSTSAHRKTAIAALNTVADALAVDAETEVARLREALDHTRALWKMTRQQRNKHQARADAAEGEVARLRERINTLLGIGESDRIYSTPEQEAMRRRYAAYENDVIVAERDEHRARADAAEAEVEQQRRAWAALLERTDYLRDQTQKQAKELAQARVGRNAAEARLAEVAEWVDEAPEQTAGLDLLRQIIHPLAADATETVTPADEAAES